MPPLAIPLAAVASESVKVSMVQQSRTRVQQSRARRVSRWTVRSAMWLSLLPGLLSPALAQSAQSDTNAIANALQGRRFDEAVRLCGQALKSNPESYKLWTLEGMAFARFNQPKEAEAAYGHALKLAPYYLPALEGAAELKYQQGDTHAIPLLKKILTVGGDNATTHGMLAVLEYKQKNCTAAVDDFRLSSSTASGNPTMLTEYGFCLAELKHYTDAAPIFQQALNLQPRVEAARFNLSLAQLLANDGESALTTLQPLLASAGASNDTLNLAADIYQSRDDTPRAVELLRRAIVQEPRNVENYIEFATLSNKYGSFQAGIAMVNAGLANVPKSARLYVARGVLYSQLSDYRNALADFEHANQLDPNLAVASSAEGLMQSQQHNLDAALETFRSAARKRPNDAFTQYLLAEALSEKGYPAGSAGSREEIAAATRAVNLDTGLVAAHDLLASLYLQSGEIQLAVQHSEAALRKDPNDQQALYHLILALRKTDRKGEVAGLSQQLTKLRQSAQAEGQIRRRYQLSVQPASGEATAVAPIP